MSAFASSVPHATFEPSGAICTPIGKQLGRLHLLAVVQDAGDAVEGSSWQGVLHADLSTDCAKMAGSVWRVEGDTLMQWNAEKQRIQPPFPLRLITESVVIRSIALHSAATDPPSLQ